MSKQSVSSVVTSSSEQCSLGENVIFQGVKSVQKSRLEYSVIHYKVSLNCA